MTEYNAYVTVDKVKSNLETKSIEGTDDYVMFIFTSDVYPDGSGILRKGFDPKSSSDWRSYWRHNLAVITKKSIEAVNEPEGWLADIDEYDENYAENVFREYDSKFHVFVEVERDYDPRDDCHDLIDVIDYFTKETLIDDHKEV